MVDPQIAADASSPSGNYMYDSVQTCFSYYNYMASAPGESPSDSQSLIERLPRLSALRGTLGQTLHLLALDPEPQRAVTQRSIFLNTYAQLITTLVKELHRLDMCAENPQKQDVQVFLELWGALHASSLVFTYFWALCTGMDQTYLNSANHALMLWMLPFVNSSYHTRMGANGDKRERELTAIMQIPLNSLNHISSTGGSNMSRALSALHADYVPLLCRIACDKVGSLVYADSTELRKLALKATAAAISAPNIRNVGCHPHPVPHDFEHLVAVVVAVVNCSNALSTHNPDLLTSFTRPAVCEALKYAIILCGPQRGVAKLPQGDSCVLILQNLINMGMHIMIARVSEGLPSVPPLQKGKNAGPDLTPPERRTDMLLLETLSKRVANDPPTAFLTFNLMGVVIQIWRQAEEGASAAVPKAVQTERDLCFVMLAQQCTLYGRKWMQQQQKLTEQQLATSSQAGTSRQQLMSVDAQSCFGSATMQHVSSLMSLVCMNSMRVRRSYMRSTKALPLFKFRMLKAEHDHRFKAVIVRQQRFPNSDPSEGNALLMEGESLDKELQHSLQSHAASTMQVWSFMPGSVWTLESMFRDTHHPQGAKQTSHAVLISANVMQTGALADVATLPAFISLAATARKLLHVHTGCGTMGSSRQRAQNQPDYFNYHPDQVLTLDSAECVMSTFVESISQIKLQLDILSNKRSSSNNSSSTSSSGAAKSSAGVRRRPKVPNIPGRASASKDTGEDEKAEGSDANMFSKPSHQSLLHQLQAIQIAGLLQLCHWKMGYETEAHDRGTVMSTPAWLTTQQRLSKSMLSKDLAALFESLLSPKLLASRKAQLEVNVELERYAIAHFHGRLTPGCCNMACTNMAGASEAALKTKLCSGCMRARYCSAACQKTAWKEGGHQAVCENQQ